MDNRWTMDKEIAKCFEENPELIHKSMKDVAAFFYIQGQLYKSNAAEAMQQRLYHYLKHLPEECKKQADKEWETMVNKV